MAIQSIYNSWFRLRTQNPVLLLKRNEELLQLDNAKRAVQYHQNNKEYPIAQDTYKQHFEQAEEETKKDIEERNILILPERNTFSITAQDYFDILRFLAENPKEAEKYLKRVSEKEINAITFYLRSKDYVDYKNLHLQICCGCMVLTTGLASMAATGALAVVAIGCSGCLKKPPKAVRQKFHKEKKKADFTLQNKLTDTYKFFKEFVAEKNLPHN